MREKNIKFDPIDDKIDRQFLDYLGRTGRIAIIWSIDDVKSVRPDLTDAQCMEVLDECVQRDDANDCWTTIEVHADYLFPKPDGQSGTSGA